MSDLISRQAAIDALEETDWYHQNKNKDMVHGANSELHQAWYKEQDVFKAIEQLPSAEPEQKKGEWIPVTERLPEEEKTVLTWGKKHQCILFDWMHDNKWCFGDEDYWMPLPEPPTIIEAEDGDE